MRGILSHLGFFAIFFAACVVAYCSGTKLLTALSDNITDHTGTPNYNNEMNCIWVIQPANTSISSITLSFQKFDLEYSYDLLLIYDCLCTDDQYAWFTGSTVPQDVIVPSNVVTLVFLSDEYVTGAGFSLTYYANNCPGNCSGRGTCHKDHCDCYPGYMGTDCGQTYCYNNCSYPFGECNLATNSCMCALGYYGGDCSDVYCNGLSSTGDSVGTFTDHRGYGDYLNNMDCQWLIQPDPPRQSITLSFTYFDTEAGYDFVTIYDGNSTSSPIIGRYSGTNIPPRTTATSGFMLVRWTSDVGVTRTGFDASFNATNCPGFCSGGHGDCIDGACHCDVGFAAEDCSQTACTDDCFGRGVCEDIVLPNQACNCGGTNFTGLNCGSCVYGSDCSIQYCASFLRAANLSGVISDKISGEGNYKADMNCKWTIDPVPYNPDVPISGLALEFSKLELELNEALVRVYRGDSTAAKDLVGLFTGEELPPVINLDDTTMTVVFVSSGTNVVRQGFQASWNIAYCPSNCNDNGVCSLGNVCDCYPGWDGPNCTQSVCVGTCNAPAGKCLDSQCVCEPGWYSPSCSSTFCSGLTTLNGDSGILKDHADGETYRSNSNCDFRVQHQNATETYSLVWTQFVLDNAQGDSTDYVNLYDGPDTTAARLLAIRSGSFLPHPVRSSNSSLFLQFRSGNEVNFPGFVVVYTANSVCPGSCNGKGYCYNGTCICDEGTTGANCSTQATATKITYNHTVNGTVTSFQWKYYSFKITKKTNQVFVESYQTSNQGNSEFYLMTNSFPGLYHYNIAVGLGVQGFTIKNPPEGSTLYLGVYENSVQYSDYTITISADEEDEAPDYRAAAIAIVVIVFLLFGAAGVCVFVLWRKTRKLKKEQQASTPETQDTHEMTPQTQGPGYARFEDE